MEQENRELKELLNNNSSNSSKPLSQDLKKKKSKKNSNPNKGGGTKGHPGHFRNLLDTEDVDDIVSCPLRIMTQALEEPVKDLLGQVKTAANVHMDETGHCRDGAKQWLWGMMSENAAFFSVQQSRGKKVIKSLMGDFDGFIISDRYAAYNFFSSDKRQVCWAYLKRDFTNSGLALTMVLTSWP